jgi:hypothetical protein
MVVNTLELNFNSLFFIFLNGKFHFFNFYFSIYYLLLFVYFLKYYFDFDLLLADIIKILF